VSAGGATVRTVTLVDVLLPPTCAACAAPGWPLCRSCIDEVGVVTPPWCGRCGRPSEEPLASCVDCPPRPIGACRAPFLYDGPVSRAILGMKFSGWHGLGRHLAGAMVEVAVELLPADVIGWVPLSRRRRSRRGFDQAEVIALDVARRLDLPARSLLRRVRDTAAQARKGGTERRRALRDAFAPRGSVEGHVLLVDDVLTTGTTAASCAAALHRAGARRVSVLTAARSLGGPVPARCLGLSGRLGGPGASRVR
jgi:ComF family protein